MQIMGMKLRKPDSRDMFFVGIVVLLNIGLLYLLMDTSEGFSSFLGLVCSAFAGSFLAACGISIREHGLKAAFLLLIVILPLYIAVKEIAV